MNDLLRQRCERFLLAFGTPVSKFCRMITLSPAAYYKARRGELELSDATVSRIDDFLTGHGF